MTNLELVKSYQEAVWETKDISAIDKYCDENVLIHSPAETTQGTEKMRAIISQWYEAFPDLKVFWDDFIGDGDKVVCRWHASGN
ncbi:MAG: ester cyclase, partial [Legionellaceae bacterium]|nr:ester cyclase [Legionellaceae bacterium]